MTDSATSMQVTKPAKRWLLKSLAVTIVLSGFGIWGLYDALVAYPDRGRKVASYRLFEYLETARHPSYGFDGTLGVPADGDPAQVLNDLRSRKTELEQAAEGTRESAAREAAAQLALLNYLESLAVMFDLSIENAHIAEPDTRYTELRDEWRGSSGETREAPKPLASYDIPVQWIFVLVGGVGGIWGTIFIARVISVKYSWDAETKRLTLPNGATLVPEDVAEFDKRKWDKFLIFLKIKETHESLAGQELRIDLYRHDPLEDWIIEMHRTAFPEDFEDEDDSEDTPSDDESQDTAADSQEDAESAETRA